MVGVAEKPITARRARACAVVHVAPATARLLREGRVAKGDALAVARIAGIQAAKRTSELVPLCHAVALTRTTVDLAVARDHVRIDATAEALDRTGVEMEALTAVSVAGPLHGTPFKVDAAHRRVVVEKAADAMEGRLRASSVTRVCAGRITSWFTTSPSSRKKRRPTGTSVAAGFTKANTVVKNGLLMPSAK